VPVGKKLRLTGHAGVLVPLDRRGYYGESYRSEVDWRLGIARDIGPVTVSAAWTGVTRNDDLEQQRYYGRRALVFGITFVR